MIAPKTENQDVGFSYTVTLEQMQKHAALPPEEILLWIEETAAFIYELQTPEERERKYIYKPNKRPLHLWRIEKIILFGNVIGS